MRTPYPVTTKGYRCTQIRIRSVHRPQFEESPSDGLDGCLVLYLGIAGYQRTVQVLPEGQVSILPSEVLQLSPPESVIPI